VRRGALEKLVEEEWSGREDRSKQIWQLLTLELWLKNATSQGVAS
jgi:asparagine synthase (glutamine-hydrolysing)